MEEGYLIDAGWLFLAAWSMVVLVVSWVAFGKDLMSSPSSAHAAGERRTEMNPR